MALTKEEIISTVFKSLAIKQPDASAISDANTKPTTTSDDNKKPDEELSPLAIPTVAQTPSDDEERSSQHNSADNNELLEIPDEHEHISREPSTHNHLPVANTLDSGLLEQPIQNNHIISHTVGILIAYAQQQCAQHGYPKKKCTLQYDLSFITIQPLINAFSKLQLTNEQWAELCQRDFAFQVSANEARDAYIASTLVTMAYCFNFNYAVPNKIQISNALYRVFGTHTTASDSIIGQINIMLFNETCNFLLQHENTVWAKAYLTYIQHTNFIPNTLSASISARLSNYNSAIWQLISDDSTAIPISIKAFLLVEHYIKPNMNNIPILRIADLLAQITPEQHITPALWLPLNILAYNYRHACTRILVRQGIQLKEPDIFLNCRIYLLNYNNQFRSLEEGEIIRQAIKWNSMQLLHFQDSNALAFLTTLAYEYNSVEAKTALQNCLMQLPNTFHKLARAIQSQHPLAELYAQRIAKISQTYARDFTTMSEAVVETTAKYKKYEAPGFRELYKVGRFFQKEAAKLNGQAHESEIHRSKSRFGDPERDGKLQKATRFNEAGDQFVAAAEKRLTEFRR